MTVTTFPTRLIQLHTYLLHFWPDLPGQLVTFLLDDDIKEILYHAMPNTWEKKIVIQGYYYLDGSIHSMVEFFETKTENLEKSRKCFLKKQDEEQLKKGSNKREGSAFRRFRGQRLRQGT